jgi:tetratricopeptide (TPR) repeat protein
VLAHTNALVRVNAAQSLGALAGQGNAAVDAALRKLLDDEARSVRYAAAWALRASLDLNSNAGKELLQTLDYNQDQPVGQLQKGAFLLARNQMEAALMHFAKAVAWDARSADIRQEYATVLSLAGRTQDALAQIQEACRLAPNNADHWYRLGLAWNEAGNLGEVVKALEAAVRVDPRHARSWYNLGLARHQAGDADGAVDALTRAESADASSPDYPYARATVLARLGRHAEARSAALRALEIAPRHVEARQLLDSLPTSR